MGSIAPKVIRHVGHPRKFRTDGIANNCHARRRRYQRSEREHNLESSQTLDRLTMTREQCIMVEDSFVDKKFALTVELRVVTPKLSQMISLSTIG